jgi:hypothetical protein
MGERRGRWEDEDEWLPVLRPPYVDARHRHAKIRADAYAIARTDALHEGLCGPDLWLGDIDANALAVWERTWVGVHPSGAGKWNWRALVDQLPRRAAVLPVAIWSGNDLCGMALGHASRPRFNRSRHTVTLTHLERRPEPPDVPLHGSIANLAFGVIKRYGEAVGARRLRLLNPDRNLLEYYGRYGFGVVWKGKVPVFCEKELYS